MDEFRDLETLNHWHELCESRPDEDHAKALAKLQYHTKSRDNARTPMQWTNGTHTGFTNRQPWFRVNDTYTECNAAAQVGVSGSPFEHWSAILGLRKDMADIFIYGDFEMVDAQHGDVFAYTRSYNGESVLVVCNFRERPVEWKLPLDPSVARMEQLLISTHGVLLLDADTVSLRPFEAFACAHSRVSS